MKKLYDLVEYILENNPQARNSDDVLYIEILKIYAERKNFDIRRVSIISFYEGYRKLKIPSIESVGRARRKVQENRSDLCATNSVKEYRTSLEDEFRAFARG